MQNLEAYQKLEVEKQLLKIQITTAFQNYLNKALSICLSQQNILQKAGINPANFFGVGPNGRPNLLQPAYFDPATIFGPSLALFNTMVPQTDARVPNQTQNNLIPQNNSLSMHTNTMNTPQSFPYRTHSMNSQNSQNMQNSLLIQGRLSEPIQKNDSLDKDGLLDEFFEQRISGTSTNYSYNPRDETEVETGKKIGNERTRHLETLFQPTTQKTKVVCGHPWKLHHAKGLCKNCYEMYGKTRKPWKCDHQAHFAKGYCKRCYLRIRQQKVAKEGKSIPNEDNAMKNEEKKESNVGVMGIMIEESPIKAEVV